MWRAGRSAHGHVGPGRRIPTPALLHELAQVPLAERGDVGRWDDGQEIAGTTEPVGFLEQARQLLGAVNGRVPARLGGVDRVGGVRGEPFESTAQLGRQRAQSSRDALVVPVDAEQRELAQKSARCACARRSTAIGSPTIRTVTDDGMAAQAVVGTTSARATSNHTHLPVPSESVAVQPHAVESSSRKCNPRPVTAEGSAEPGTGGSGDSSSTSTRMSVAPTSTATWQSERACSTAFVTTSLTRSRTVSRVRSSTPRWTKASSTYQRARRGLAGSSRNVRVGTMRL